MNIQIKRIVAGVSILIPLTIFLIASKSDNTPQQYWVSSNGNDTTGNGSQTNPWQHINYAIQQIGPDSLGVAQRILDVLPGTYSPSTTGEVFPIEMVNNLWLKGTDSINTILDGERLTHLINCWYKKNMTISGFTIKNGEYNINGNSGGVSCRHGAEVEIFNCLFTNCEQTLYTAIDLPDMRDSVTYVYAHNNIFISNDGNGIIVTGGDLLCEDNIFDNNEAGEATGSSVALIGGAYRVPTVIIKNNIMKNSHSRGGAIFTGNGNVTVEGNIIFNNTASGPFTGGGAGIFAWCIRSNICIIRDNIIIGNKSSVSGGGLTVFTYQTPPGNYCYIQRNVIAYNEAGGKGGAIAVHEGSAIIVGGQPGMGNDIFKNTGYDSVNLFYHDLPAIGDTMNFQYNFLGNNPSNYSQYIEPDSLFNISNYSDSMLICGNSYDCDSLFNSIFTGIEDIEKVESTNDFRLYKNYPNPFNPSTSIKYDLYKTALIRLRIYNLLGEEVKQLINEKQGKGEYNISWNGDDKNGELVSSGMYFYHLQIDHHVRVGKMILAK